MKPICIPLLLLLGMGSLGAQNPDLQLLPDTSSQGSNKPASIWTMATTFNSRVLSAGRDFGQSQFGVFPNVSYNHASGLYAGIGGSILGDSVLSYTQSNLSLGYNGTITPSWRFGLGFSHTFFHPMEEGLLSNGLMITSDVQIGVINMGTSFVAMLGEENGYRLNVFAAGYLPLGTQGFWSNWAIAPAASGLLGTENIPFQQLPLSQFEKATGARWIERKKNIPTLPKPGTRHERSSEEFGLMSLNFAVPLHVYLSNWSLSLVPNLVIPVPLPGETYTVKESPSAYFSLAMAWQF